MSVTKGKLQGLAVVVREKKESGGMLQCCPSLSGAPDTSDTWRGGGYHRRGGSQGIEKRNLETLQDQGR